MGPRVVCGLIDRRGFTVAQVFLLAKRVEPERGRSWRLELPPKLVGQASEVKATAYSISTWCWSGGGARWHFDHSSAAQRRRGIKSGKVRRRVQAERDAAILSDLVAGMGVRATARKWGLAHNAVRHIVGRVDNEPNQLGLGV